MAKLAKAKAAKVPIATLRELEKQLQGDSHDAQVARVWRTLAQLPPERRGQVAAAALAHTRKGSPLARAVLASVGEAASADLLVRHSAAMTRGRGQVFGALVSLWQLATDVDALEAAYANFTRSFVDNPRLLELGIHAATRRGDAASAAARGRALDCARRVAPVVDELRGTDAAKKRAAATVKTLDAEDRRQVYLRVLEAPRQVTEAVALDAVDATVLDPTVGDSALVNAVVDMRYHGGKQLVAAWQTRVKTDAALRDRLVRLLDWLGELATDDDQLEPFIHALAPVSGEPEVFALVMRLFASPNTITRATVCEEWVREDDGRAGFTNEQMAAVMREVARIAQPGEDKQDDARAAGRALFYGHHPGARAVLMETIRAATPSQDKLRWNCYFGLDEDAPDVRAFMIERLFEEDDEYWALLEWFEGHTDAGVHREVLDALAARRADARAIHAATAYFDAMFDKKKAPRFAIGLARAVADWTATTKEDGRRLRYIFEAGTAAALQVNDPASARALLARVTGELPSPAYSDYQEVDRDNKTKAHLADKQVVQQLAALAAGKLDAAIEKLRAQADAARARHKPVALSDADLGLLAGCAVTARLLDDAASKVVWFFDEVGALYAYDGYAVTLAAAAGIAWVRLDWRTAPRALVGAAPQPVDERVVFADGKAAGFREVQRLGRHLLVYSTDGSPRSTGRSRVAGSGLTLASVEAARDAFARFAASPPAGKQRRDPWYVDNRGAVSREYSVPMPDGDHEQPAIAVVGSELRGRLPAGFELAPRHDSPAAAVAAFAAWEARVYGAGGQLHELGVDPEATRREDTTIAAFLEDRYRDDDKDAAWHARAIAEMVQAVRDAGLDGALPDLMVHAGPPATADAIAAYQASVPEPLPDTLVSVWREVGPFGFTSAARSIRLLGPTELIVSRDKLRAMLRAWAPAHLKASRAKQLVAMADHCDPIALDGEGPAILFDTRQQHADGRCFSSDGSWWEVALGWCIAVDIAAPLKKELDRRCGEIHLLRLGQRASGEGAHARMAQAGKTFEAIAEGVQTLTRTSTANGPGKPAIKAHRDAAAAKAFVKAAVAARKAKRWR